MQATISPGKIKGAVTPPPSKSLMQRACAAALLHKGKTIIYSPDASNDAKAALHIIQQLGAEVHYKGDHLEVHSNGISPISDTIDCGESGLSARLFMPIAALHHQPITVTGQGSLLKRPMLFFRHILPELGATVSGENQYLPLTVKGPVQPADIKIDGSVSSQYLSGLLFAYAASAQPYTINVDNLTSKPYTDLTIEVLQKFGTEIEHEQYRSFHILKPITQHHEVRIEIEKDWSSAAALLVAGAIAGSIVINNLNINSQQADRAILTLLQSVGADITVADGYIEVKQRDNLHAFHTDITNCPDLAPVLAVLAACCKGTCQITGIHRLVYKESNRIESISAMLTALGVDFNTDNDSLNIKGSASFKSCTINAYNDHRIVMAAAIAALRADGDTIINGAEAVAKSYPDFFSHLSSLGAKCILKDE